MVWVYAYNSGRIFSLANGTDAHRQVFSGLFISKRDSGKARILSTAVLDISNEILHPAYAALFTTPFLNGWDRSELPECSVMRLLRAHAGTGMLLRKHLEMSAQFLVHVRIELALLKERLNSIPDFQEQIHVRPIQSHLNATIGSTLAARRAGSQQAISAPPKIMAMLLVRVIRSNEEMP
jgi:hypothetical protein